MRTRLFKKVAAIIGAGIMTVGLLAPMSVWATEASGTQNLTTGRADGGVTTNGQVTINKFIQADPNAVIPANTFTYSITPLGIGDASVTTDMPALTIVATDTNKSSTNGTQQTTEDGLYYQDNSTTKKSNVTKATNNLVIDAHYASDGNVSVTNGDGVAWPYAGVFRYYITETNTASGDWTYMTDGNTGYEIAFYVENITSEGGTATLQVSHILVNKATKTAGDISDTTVTPTAKVDPNPVGDENTNKDGDGLEFTNRYDPKVALEINKTVTGNAADKTKLFKFTISNLTLPSSYTATNKDFNLTYTTSATVDNTYSDGVTRTTTNTTITAGTDKVVYLGDNEKVTIADLPVGTTYTVTEEGQTNYKATYQVKEGGTALTAVTGTRAAAAASSGTIKATTAAADTENIDAYTNKYEVTTPTGIILSNLPAFAAIFCALGLAVFALIARRKRSR